MKKATIIALSIVICLAALFWITIETNPEIATRLGFASGPGKPIEVTPDTPNAMVPSIVYEGNLYRTTGKQIPAEVDDSAIVGCISSVVPLSQLPSNEGEANFGEVGDPYAITSDGLLVIMGREWILFELAESQYDKSGSNLGVSTSVLHATVLEVHDGYFLVEPMEGSWELNSASRIEVPMKTIEPSPEPQVGVLLEIEYDGQLLETYPARISNPYSIKVIEEAELWDRIPMVMVNGTLYLDTGRESTVMARCGMMDGEITSQVPGNEEPTVDDQSNFGTGYGYQYGEKEGTIEINMNGKWWVFATEEARKEIQFPSEETNGELMIDPVVPVTVVNLITGEMQIVNSNPSIRAIQSLISSEWWSEGNPACDNDYKITVNDESYWYHSDCGTLTDINHDSCITLNESQKATMDVLIAVGQDSDFGRYWLTVGEDGVKRIEIKTAYSSGGCENADGSLYQKGDRIWLECLDGFLDLRGVSFTALDEAGQIIWQASIPDGEDNEGFTHLRNDDWNVTNIP